MISVDDMNNWVKFLKNFNEVKTPNLDRLAKKSFIFSNAHAPATLCNPSRTAIITGKLPSSTGIYNNSQSAKNFITITKTETIFEHFRKNNYLIFGAGKLFHVKNDIQVFDDFFRPKRDITNIGSATPWAINNDPSYNNPDNQVSDWVVNKLAQRFDKPFFMSVGFFFPHHPWIMPKKYFDYYPLDKIKIPETIPNDYDDIPIIARTRIIKFLELNSNLKQHNKLKQNIQAYLAAITYMDEQLGKILDALENSRYRNNTIIVFWSDHGYHLGEKHTLRKSTLWQASTQVPFLISVPNQQGRINTAVSLIDIFPTLVDLCHIPKPSCQDGFSLVNLMRHKSNKRPKPIITVQDHGNYAIQDDSWKLIKYTDGSEEFYNLKKDPNEYINLAHDSKYKKQKNKLLNHIPKNPKNPFDANSIKSIWINGFYENKFYSFWIDRHEVTNEEFLEFIKKTNYKTSAETLTKPYPGSLVFSVPTTQVDKTNYLNWWKFVADASWQDPQGNHIGIAGKLNHPVVQVSYLDASRYCKYFGKRLPSESEWKLAAQDLKNMSLNKKNGKWNLNIYQGDFPYKDIADDGYAGTAQVMSFNPSPSGIYDLAGNVWEWVASPGSKPHSHKIKGGSFLCGNHCQGFNPEVSLDMQDDESTDHIGFRCVD
jgi:arylsulfatase A-like enzyme